MREPIARPQYLDASFAIAFRAIRSHLLRSAGE
jgi:hypothetical protein